jgi:hypothetical protein
VIEEVSFQGTLDPWLSLPALSTASGLSVCTLRVFCNARTFPLPHYRMKEPHVVTRQPRKKLKQPENALRKDGELRKDAREPLTVTVTGKILVRWSEFERWMEQYHHIPARDAYAPALDVDRLVDEVVAEFQASP